MTFLIPFVGAAMKLTYLAKRSDNGSSGFTFSAVPFGPADPNRVIIVGSAFGGLGSEPGSCNIDGIGATQVAGNGGDRRAQLWTANVPLNTAGQISFGGSGTGCGIIVWSIVPAFSVLAFETENTRGGSLLVPGGGVGVGVCYTSGGGSVNVNWNPGMTFDDSVTWNVSSTNFIISGASTIIEGPANVDTGVSHDPPGFCTASFGL